MSKISICSFIIIVFVTTSEAARILALFSTLSYADHLIFRGYMELLSRKQHHVIVMTPFPGRYKYPDVENISELDVSDVSLPFFEEYQKITSNTDDYLSVLHKLNDMSVRLALAQIRSQQMTALIVNPNIKFDLVITEADMPLLYAFADRYKAPHISITASHGKINMYDSKGNPNHPLLYPDVYALDYGNLSIWKKIREIKRHLCYRYEYYMNYLPKCQDMAERVLSLKRDLQEVEYDIDLLLVSGTHMLIGNRPTVPAIVYIDRIHIKPGLPLPQDLKRILDSSENGFIYFSLGMIQQSENLSQRTIQALMKTFGELPCIVLWKIHNVTNINAPKNVITKDWFPQQEVLAHPKIKAFITHGGPRSLEEAVFYEVPIVVVPVVSGLKVFAQQHTKFGVGVIVDPYILDSENLKTTILNVVKNSTYKNAMSKLKYLAFDQPMPGPERAIWWTEYVLRHNGARHLRAPAVGVPIYKYFMLDVLAMLLAMMFAVMFVTYVSVRRLLVWWRKPAESSGKWKML